MLELVLFTWSLINVTKVNTNMKKISRNSSIFEKCSSFDFQNSFLSLSDSDSTYHTGGLNIVFQMFSNIFKWAWNSKITNSLEQNLVKGIYLTLCWQYRAETTLVKDTSVTLCDTVSQWHTRPVLFKPQIYKLISSSALLMSF